MLNRPDYKKLVKRVREQVEEQLSQPFVAITQGIFSFGFPHHDFKESWPKVMKELGLVDDGTNTNTWTKPGHGFKLSMHL